MTSATSLFLAKLPSIEKHDEVTGKNLMQTIKALRRELTKVPCNIRETKRKGWSFVCYTDAVFQNLKGIATVAPNGTITPGAAVPKPTHPGTNVATSMAASHRHVEALALYNTYSDALEFSRQGLEWAYGGRGHLNDMKDENEALTDTPLVLIDHLWDTKITGARRDNTIKEAQQAVDAPYDPAQPLSVFFGGYQDGQQILIQLKKPTTEADMMMNALLQFEKHEDLYKYCVKWRAMVQTWLAANPARIATWVDFKKHITQSHQLLEDRPGLRSTHKVNQL